MRTFGLDPGSRVTGFGVVEVEGGRYRSIAAGTIPLPQGPLCDRLLMLHTRLSALLKLHQPQSVAIEGVFSHRAPRSALILGHARGVALLCSAQADLPVYEYAPATVKRSLTTSGGATKLGVARSVSMFLGLREALPADATDALAIAVCHLSRHRVSAAGPGTPSAWLRALAAAAPVRQTAQNKLLEVALRRR